MGDRRNDISLFWLAEAAPRIDRRMLQKEQGVGLLPFLDCSREANLQVPGLEVLHQAEPVDVAFRLWHVGPLVRWLDFFGVDFFKSSRKAFS